MDHTVGLEVSMTVLEKLQALARRSGQDPEPTPALPPADRPAQAAVAPGAVPPLAAAVCFTVPGVGDVWLVPDTAAAEKLGIPAGQWLTPPDLALLEGLGPAERLEVLRWMRQFGGWLVTAPAPAKRYGSGDKNWARDRQIAEYHRGGGA